MHEIPSILQSVWKKVDNIAEHHSADPGWRDILKQIEDITRVFETAMSRTEMKGWMQHIMMALHNPQGKSWQTKQSGFHPFYHIIVH